MKVRKFIQTLFCKNKILGVDQLNVVLADFCHQQHKLVLWDMRLKLTHKQKNNSLYYFEYKKGTLKKNKL